MYFTIYVENIDNLYVYANLFMIVYFFIVYMLNTTFHHVGHMFFTATKPQCNTNFNHGGQMFHPMTENYME